MGLEKLKASRPIEVMLCKCLKAVAIRRKLSIKMDVNPREEKNCLNPVVELVEVEIDGPERVVNIRVTLPLDKSKALE